MILAGDIGGTKTLLALFDETEGIRQVRKIREQSFPSKEHGSLEDIVGRFLNKTPGESVEAGCFGVAGPVINGRCQTTNLPWTLEEAALARILGVPRVKLLNDVEAAAYGILHLSPKDLHLLNAVETKRQGNIAVIAAGTGLGEAILYWDGAHHHPIATEGGHTEFAPRTEQQIELLQYLRRKFGAHVSYERLLSGPGIHNIYNFLRETAFAEPRWLAERIENNDPGAVISQLALANEHPLCTATLDLFCSIYGAEAGNLVLKTMGIGGVRIGGGIAPKIIPALEKGGFVEAFTAKGRFSELLENVEVAVALNVDAPLIGAAHYALRL